MLENRAWSMCGKFLGCITIPRFPFRSTKFHRDFIWFSLQRVGFQINFDIFFRKLGSYLQKTQLFYWNQTVITAFKSVNAKPPCCRIRSSFKSLAEIFILKFFHILSKFSNLLRFQRHFSPYLVVKGATLMDA